jgi:hypothetical protein
MGRATIPVRVLPPPFALAPAAIDFRAAERFGVPATQQIVLANSSAGKLTIPAVAPVAEGEKV